MTSMQTKFPVLLSVLALMLTACGQPKHDSDSHSTVTSTQPTRAGNAPFYEVFGERYQVLNSNAGYNERGVASWYGEPFHGRKTASGEVYDMHQMTAAHKNLVIPSFAKVTNLRNGKTIVVRVNDRGPFVNNRLIDLSLAAAEELDMVQSGTTLVEVTALDSASTEIPASATPIKDATLYLQVGAFSEQANAQRFADSLQTQGFANAHMDSGQRLHRVRVGPVDSVNDFDALVTRLRAIGVNQHYLVKE